MPVAIIGTLLLAYYGARSPVSRPIYRIGFSDSPPLLLAHPDGSPGGLAHEVLSEAANRAGVLLDWRLSRQLNYEFLRDGAADLWPLADPENSNGFGVTKPWARGSFAMLWLAESRGGEMLVAVNRQPRVVALLTKHSPAASRLEVDNGVQAMQAMCSGEATHAFLDARVAQRLLLARPTGCHGHHIRMEPAVGSEMPLGIMYRPGFNDAAVAVRKAIDEMALDGSLGYVFAKWSNAAYSSVELDGLLLESETRARRFGWTVLVVVALLAAALAAVATLHKARNLAIENANAKAHFVAVVSHELRTPMNGFLAMADLLANSPLKPDQKELAEAIRASAHSFQRVVADILEFSRIEARKLHIEYAPCDLNAVAARALAGVEARAASKGLDLRLVTDNSMPLVMADEARLMQISSNLLDNAVKFTHEGSVSVRVRREVPEGSKQPVTIQVSDTGVGIDPAKAAKLFTPFRQAHGSQSRRFGGLGLGLSICKGIVDAMAGRISMASEPGLGTTVTVSLLLDLAPASSTGRRVDDERRPSSARLRVLVVDDGKVNRLVASRILQKLGHDPDQAANGREAVELASSNHYAMILMDCQMPEMDGLEATRRIRAAEAGREHVPIVALTASVEPSEQGLCFEAGMDGFLQKPVSLENLREALAKYAMIQP